MIRNMVRGMIRGMVSSMGMMARCLLNQEYITDHSVYSTGNWMQCMRTHIYVSVDVCFIIMPFNDAHL